MRKDESRQQKSSTFESHTCCGHQWYFSFRVNFSFSLFLMD